MKTLISLVLLNLLIACDPADRRMKVHNLTDDYVYYLYSDIDTLNRTYQVKLYDLFKKEVNDKVKTDTVYPNRVPPNTKQIVPYNSNWENDIKAIPDNEIKFFFFEDSLLRTFTWDEIVEGQIYSKKYSLSINELKERDWIIEYRE